MIDLRCWFTPLMVAVLCCGQHILAAGVTQADGKQTSVRVIRFSGYDWEVRPSDTGGPGPNRWDPANAWVDDQGGLHLKITRQGGIWRCAEVSTTRSFGFGRYQFWVRGPLDRLDSNVVLGLYDYPAPSIGPDGTNEIDIEYSRWGNSAYPPGNYTVYPARIGLPQVSQTFTLPPGISDTSQRFIRRSDEVSFQSLRGSRYDAQKEITHWIFRPTDSRRRVPQQPLPVHINLWLFEGKPPRDGREVEIVVKRFSFTPSAHARR